MDHVRGKSRGYATIMAMVLLLVGSTLTAWLYSIVNNSMQVQRNDLTSARAMGAAESGLTYIQTGIRRVTTANKIDKTTDPDALTAIGNELVGILPAGKVIVTPSLTDPVVTFVTQELPEQLVRATFEARMSVLRRADPITGIIGPAGIRLSVTGKSGNALRTIGVDLEQTNIVDWTDFPILAKEGINMAGGPEILRWDPNAGAATTDDGVPAHIDPYDPSVGDVLLFDNTPVPPPDLQFPPKYLDADLYAKLNQMVATNRLPALSVTRDKKGNPQPVASIINQYIPPNSSPTLTDNATLEGIIYVAWPNNMTFGARTTMHGIIIYEPPPANTPLSSTIYLGKAITVECDPAAAKAAIMAAFQAAGATSEESLNLFDKTSPWSIHAPFTDVNISEGNTTGDFQFYGSWHIHSLLKAAGNGNGNPNHYCFHGSIVCEGSVDVRGNRNFSIATESSTNPGQKGITLTLQHGGYWEGTPQ